MLSSCRKTVYIAVRSTLKYGSIIWDPPYPQKDIGKKMGNPPHQAGLSILRSWPNDRNVGRTRIALIGGTREGKSHMLDVQNLYTEEQNEDKS